MSKKITKNRDAETNPVKTPKFDKTNRKPKDQSKKVQNNESSR